MSEVIKSYWWIIYSKWEDWPEFLVIKRQSLAKKIEWTAPKGKPEKWETPEQTAKREISEETGINPKFLNNYGKAWSCVIKFKNSNFEKEITYFLFEYTWDPDSLDIPPVEGYIGIYKWLPISQALNVVPYSSLREIYRKGYHMIRK